MADATHAEALHKLQAMLNLTLTEIGRIFDNPNRRRQDTLGKTKSQLRSVVGETRLNFHDALDELEAELSSARDVMRRDLAVMLDQRRTEPGQPAPVAQDTAMTDASDGPAAETAAAPVAAAGTGDAAAPTTSEEVDVGELSRGVDPERLDRPNTPLPLTSPINKATQPAEGSKSLAEDQSKTKLATSAASAPAEAVASAAPDGAPEAATNDDGGQVDLDSVFADLVGVEGTGDDGLNDPLEFSLGDAGELLPGLESYANLGSDLQTAPLDGGGDGGTAATVTTTAEQQVGGQSTVGEFNFGTAAGAAGGSVDDALGEASMDVGTNFADLFDFDDLDGGGDGAISSENIDDLFNNLDGDAS